MNLSKIEDTIREAAQSIAGTHKLPSVYIEQDLINAIMPQVRKTASCPHVVQPDEDEGTLYCKLAEGAALRLRELEKSIEATEGIHLHIIAPCPTRGNRWMAIYKIPGEGWETHEYKTFGNLILSLPRTQ